MDNKIFINTLLITFLILEGFAFLFLPQESWNVSPILTFYLFKGLWIGALFYLRKALEFKNDKKNTLLCEKVIILEIVEALIFMFLLFGIQYSDYLFVINFFLLTIFILRFYKSLITSKINKLAFINLVAITGILHVIISTAFYFLDYNWLIVFEFVSKIALLISLFILFTVLPPLLRKE